jgi:hypothetical protein
MSLPNRGQVVEKRARKLVPRTWRATVIVSALAGLPLSSVGRGHFHHSPVNACCFNERRCAALGSILTTLTQPRSLCRGFSLSSPEMYTLGQTESSHPLCPQGRRTLFENLAAVLGITIGSLFLLACIVILHSRVSRQQKELERLSQDVADLSLAEDRRFLAELRIEKAPAEARELEVVPSPPIQSVR